MAKIKITVPYPRQTVRDALEAFWDETVTVGTESPVGAVAGAVLDSLTATEVLIVIEQILNLGDQELPQTLVKIGGYSSKDEFVDHLDACLEACVS